MIVSFLMVAEIEVPIPMPGNTGEVHAAAVKMAQEKLDLYRAGTSPYAVHGLCMFRLNVADINDDALFHTGVSVRLNDMGN